MGGCSPFPQLGLLDIHVRAALSQRCWAKVRIFTGRTFFVLAGLRNGYIEAQRFMAGQSRARRTCAVALGSFLLGLSLAGADPAHWPRFLPRWSSVVLLVGVPGDVESEESYREQLQGWINVVAGGGQAAAVFVLCDDPQSVTLSASPEESSGAKEGEAVPNRRSDSKPAAGSNQSSVISHRSSVTMLKANRSTFLGLGHTLVEPTNALVVIAWGHGGRQGRTPVLHVRGPRITPADFKDFANRVGARESRWLLMFRGSGSFASELAGEGRQIICSEGETMFNDDPVGMPLLLRIAKEKPELRFADLAQELGKDTEAWYANRHLARTEEPTLWAGTDKPRPLATPAAEENAVAPAKPAEAKEAATNAVRDGLQAEVAASKDLSAVWKEIKRVEARNYPEADAVILRRRLSFTLGSNPAVAAEQEAFIQVLTPEGKHYGDFDISYSPPYEDLSFLDCEVLGSDGKLVRLDPDAIRDSREQSVGDYESGQRKFFSLPGVSPGAVMHVRYRTTWKTFPLPHVSLEIPIGQDLAAVEATVQVGVPKDSPFHFASGAGCGG